MSEKILSVKNLTINFKTDNGLVQAVRGIDFDLNKGETLCIVGESGSGKSVTSKAIMKILANNAVVADGEVFYDGKDLLKISEEEMVTLRGDKIAMIFQDPLSSLNPIVRIGKQLTEAMILNNKASRKNAKQNFNQKLKLLNQNMDAVAEKDQNVIAANHEQCKTFDQFCIQSTKLESAYNEAYRTAIELKLDVDNTLFLVSKNQPIDIRKAIKSVIATIPGAVHANVVAMDGPMQKNVDSLSASLSGFGRFGKIKEMPEACVAALKEISALLEEATNRPKPNYFTLGFYMMKNPDAKLDRFSVEEQNAMTQKYLDDNFLLKFIDDASSAVLHSHRNSIRKKELMLKELSDALVYFGGQMSNKKEALTRAEHLAAGAEDAIDYLSTVKKSAEYTFRSSIFAAVNKYFDAIQTNARETERFEKESRSYENLVSKGKKLEWKVAPACITEIEPIQENILEIIRNLAFEYEKDLKEDASFDSKKEVVALIDYFKEQASAVVYKVTQKMAKVRALKLMEEVGIPEPAIRYNQYPFEFSGGMRQRIVIAIALAANPDILICDEPTTALDVTIQSQILELINRLKEERHLSVIFITHDLGVVANMADRIAVMYAGKIVEYGTADDVFYSPAHPYTWALLASMPDLDTSEKLDAIPGTPPDMIYPPKGDAFAPRNKYAMNIDFEYQPPMFKISDTHYAATWLLHPDAPKVDPPKIVMERIEGMKKKESI